MKVTFYFLILSLLLLFLAALGFEPFLVWGFFKIGSSELIAQSWF
jgi:hypothetical protein